ncbi:MFS transporter [Bradyrhizobium sp. MOS001]|uniref:MFS transporter n=1 Tax=Bradyrhizobium sp. MOS001 TaxID=2133948 RepID=UPI00143022E7|nr:MFS transporter [Bradyrhizobium sp. MOS001]
MAASLQSTLKPAGRFSALAVPNFRRFVLGQGISLIGSWTETVAQAILVLQLTNSATGVGFVTAIRYLPVLLLTPYAGLLVDRYSKRRILLGTAFSLAVLSVIQAVLVLTNTISIGFVYLLALAFGTLSALDNPARQAFIPEMVSKEYVRSAVTLNSTFVNVGRALGPMVAAGLIASVGIGWCFLTNAASFGAVLFALTTMTLSELHPVKPAKAARGQLFEGFRYALTVPEIIGPIAMMALIGTLTYEFEVSLPLFARVSLDGTSTTYSWLIGAFGAGSVAGGFYAMWRPATGLKRLSWIAVFYAAAMLATAFTSNVSSALSFLLMVGFASILFLTTGNSTIQLAASPEYRGRVMALWSTAFIGSTPVGASIIGAIDAVSPRLALGVGAAACIAAAGVGAFFAHRCPQAI